MSDIVIVYFSGYGHTTKIAQAVAQVDPRRITGCVVQGGIGNIGGASVVLPYVDMARRFGDEARELAIVYRKFGTIDDSDFIRMTNPPERDTLLHNLRRRQRNKQKMLAQHPEMAQQLAGGGGKKK